VDENEYGTGAGRPDGPLTGLVRSQPWTLTEEQLELRDVVRRVLEKHAPAAPEPADEPGGYDAGLWRRLADGVGVAGLGVPEDRGGAGGSYLDCHVVLAELGRAAVASPYPATMIAAQALVLAGDGALLPRIAAGELTAALVHGLTVRDGTATGVADLVLDGARADVLLAPAGDTLYRLEPGAGLRRDTRTTMDRSLHLATVRADGVDARPLGTLTAAARARLDDLGPVALTAVQAGGAERCLDRTVEYAKQRVQFGRPIGSFQAVKHRLADLLVLVDTAATASWAAAAAWAADAADSPLLADIAASWCGEAYRQVAAETVQLHGGIAITWEHDAHRHLKQAHTTATLFGTPRAHRERLATHLPG
jgi:alkylation response protein AidB-like acyl-CoA dehydrogenase